MEERILFNPSAFKHNATEADICRAIETKMYEGTLKGYQNKYAIVGFDIKGNLLKVMYNIINDTSINIFHAMKARKGMIKQLERVNRGTYGVYDR